MPQFQRQVVASSASPGCSILQSPLIITVLSLSRIIKGGVSVGAVAVRNGFGVSAAAALVCLPGALAGWGRDRYHQVAAHGLEAALAGARFLAPVDPGLLGSWRRRTGA